MSNYTKTVDFAAKDTLPSGDSGKIIKGTEFETEFDNISTAIATKADSAAPTFTGTSVFTNLDINGTVQADGAVTVGVDDTGYDVKFFGATAGKSLLWDESADTLIVTGTTTLVGTANLDAVDVDGDMTFGDNNKAIFGAGSDLQIYHTGTYSLIADTSGTGPLRVVTNTFQLNNAADTQNMINAAEGGAVNLYHAGNAKLATTATGIDVTGDIVLGDTNPTITMNDSSVTNLQHLITSSSDRLIIAADNNDVSAGSKIEFYVDGTKYSEVTPTGIDVTGTVTADGLTVDGNARIEEIGAIAKLTLERGGSANAADSAAVDLLETNAGSEGANFGDAATNGFRLKLDGSANDFLIQSGASGTVNTRFGIDRDSGDISFYNGAAAQGLFWDSSASALGLGTTSPNNRIDAVEAQGTVANVLANGTYVAKFTGNTTYTTGASQGILIGGVDGSLRGVALVAEAQSALNDHNFIIAVSGTSATPTERVRVAGANLLVGQTTNTTTGTGVGLVPDGTSHMYSAGTDALMLGRGVSDGDILSFNRSGTPVGAIGTIFDDLYIGTGDTNIRFDASNDAITPRGSGGSARPDAVDLGSSSVRFKDLHLSGGVVFGATGGAVSSKTLDDYEEGTWTPAYTGTTGGAVTYGTQTGSYTKVGNLVTVVGELRAKRNTLSGNVEITGLPFTNSGNGAGLSVNFASSFATDMPNLTGYTTSTKIALRKNATNSASGTPVVNTDLADAATTENYLYFSVTYLT